MADRIGRVENAYLCHNGYRFFFGFCIFFFLNSGSSVRDFVFYVLEWH
jgi:hypothetical protein